MKTVFGAWLALAGAAAIAAATELPGYDSAERVIPEATDAVVGTLTSAVHTSEPGNRVLLVTIKTERRLWGTNTTAVLEARYREFTIPEIPEGMGVDFVNYTGSGIEWKAKPKETYICLLKEMYGAFSLLRLELVTHEERLLELHRKQKADPNNELQPTK